MRRRRDMPTRAHYLSACALLASIVTYSACSSDDDNGDGAAGDAGVDASAHDATSGSDGHAAHDSSIAPDSSFTDGDDDAAPEDASDALDAKDAAPPYSPCPPKGTPCAIMPLGDSITYGVGSTGAGGGYRVELFHQATSHQQSITFVGSDANGPTTVDNVPFPRNHEGHSGYTIDNGTNDAGDHRNGLQPFIAATLQAKKPNIVTLMIGTNDVDISLDVPTQKTRLAKLVDTILGADSSLLLVIAQIVPTKTDAENARVQAYNADIPGIVSARANAGKHIVMVDMYSAFTADAAYKTKYLSDNLHPTDAGYVVMGDVWYAAIGPLLR